ncbi:acyl-CoA dehydrogenase family protein [Rhizorhabdus argentea]|uniref:acyl-CoA dehydrogenase family protein n=1 Tax=Rhizorhabdus argentea TaxID=1387174 RepID=UPI0030EC30F0
MPVRQAVQEVLIPNSQHSDWLSKEQLNSITPEILVERMKALAPLVADNAREAERLRRPVDDVWSAIRKTGVLYHFVPKKYGGLEFDIGTFIDAVLPVAEGCASTAWVTAFCMEHNYLLANFPEEAQEEIFSQFPYITAPGTLYPPGNAVAAQGGYRLTGRWKWGTGVMHSDWIMVGAMAAQEGGDPELRFFLMPTSEVAVLDTWYVDGMVGTGSNDILINNLFVPEHRTLAVAALRSGTAWGPKLHGSWIFQVSMPVLLALTAAIASLGGARRSVRYLEERLVGGDPKLTERPAAHMRLGTARLETHSAESIMRAVGHRVEAIAKSGVPATLAQRVEMRAQICYAVELCRTAVRRISEIAGSGSHSLDNPVQRFARDLNVISTHALLEWDGASEAYGRSLIGLAPNSMVDGK